MSCLGGCDCPSCCQDAESWGPSLDSAPESPERDAVRAELQVYSTPSIESPYWRTFPLSEGTRKHRIPLTETNSQSVNNKHWWCSFKIFAFRYCSVWLQLLYALRESEYVNISMYVSSLSTFPIKTRFTLLQKGGEDAKSVQRTKGSKGLSSCLNETAIKCAKRPVAAVFLTITEL